MCIHVIVPISGGHRIIRHASTCTGAVVIKCLRDRFGRKIEREHRCLDFICIVICEMDYHKAGAISLTTQHSERPEIYQLLVHNGFHFDMVVEFLIPTRHSFVSYTSK